MKICNLSSGSDGNLTYIETEKSKILVDIGLSSAETEKRLRYLQVNPEQINAIFISHEHIDHIKGLNTFASKYKTKVFVHEDGFNSLVSKLKKQLDIVAFKDNFFNYNDLTVQTTALPHDVKRCTGYSIIENKKKVSIFTDLGHTTNDILQNLCGSDLIFLEANHDVDMLKANKSYPEILKKRILSDNGHLSNKMCGEAIVNLVKNGTKNIVLAHLSRNNNTPLLAYNFIKQMLFEAGIQVEKDVKINVASIVPKAIFRAN